MQCLVSSVQSLRELCRGGGEVHLVYRSGLGLGFGFRVMVRVRVKGAGFRVRFKFGFRVWG